ncbi:MAG TPA: protein O-GlcNAcase [Gaiellaceae bacterium]
MSLPLRGIIEGFYGAPWSHRERLDLLAFCGRHELNTFVYAPKDDPYHRESWREPYPPAELARLAELVAEAERHGVAFHWSLAPGLDVCHSSDRDFERLVAKAEQLWSVGVRAFHLLYDDIGDELHCDRDRERFGGEASPSAAAQAFLSNRFRRAFLESRPEAERLVVCPIEYHGTHTSPYRETLGAQLDADVLLWWTGPEVVSKTISRADAEAARAAFGGHELLLWDNYPVNDFEPSRLFLGPLVGREPGLDLAGAVANGMIQAAPGKLAFATFADWTRDPDGYDPGASYGAALRSVGGEAAGALRVLADASRSGPLGGEDALAEPAALAAAADELEARLDDAWFLDAAAPWIETLRAVAAGNARRRYHRLAPGLVDAAPDFDFGGVRTVASPERAEDLRESAEPLLAWGGLVELGLAEGAGHVFLDEALTIEEPGHPLAAGRSGVVRIYRGPGRLRFGRGVPAEATVVATGGTPPRPVLFAVEAGAELCGGGVAPARRVGIFLPPDGVEPWLVAPTGEALVRAAVDWLKSGVDSAEPPKSGGAEVSAPKRK